MPGADARRARRGSPGRIVGRQHRRLRARLRPRRGGRTRHRAAAARRLAARPDGRARAHRQPLRRYRRDLQRRGLRADARPLRRRCASACCAPPTTCFGHRLMMDRDRARRRRRRPRRTTALTRSRASVARLRQRFPRLVELYDNTASLQDRTVGTGILDPELARQFGAGGYVGRASGRDFDARRRPGYPPYDALDLRRAGARGRRRQCARLDPHPRGRAKPVADRADRSPALPDGPIARRAAAPVARRGHGAGRGRSAATCWSGSGWTPAGASRAATCAIRPGSSGRCWKPRSRATSSPTSRSATNRSTAPIPGTISEDRDARADSRMACSARR